MNKVVIEMRDSDGVLDLWVQFFLTEIEARAYILAWRLAHHHYISHYDIRATINEREV